VARVSVFVTELLVDFDHVMASAALDTANRLFDEEKFAEAREMADKAIAAATEADANAVRSLKLLVRKCNTHLPAEAAPAAQPAAAPAAPAVPAKPQTSCRHEWFQTPTTVTFSFYARNRTSDQVAVTSEKRSLEVVIKLDEGKEFQLSHDPLFAEIDPTKTEINVRQPKVEVVLYKKLQGLHWVAVELQGEAAAQLMAAPTPAPPVAALPATQQQLAYPNSKGKDWSRFKTDEEEEDKNKLSGDEGLNKLFKDIYSNATDENRRAMIKSFTESGGTVLSTNWEDIGKRKVEGDPPKGMEKKTWEQ
jgi:suppressor of G2 allele of SKP1